MNLLHWDWQGKDPFPGEKAYDVTVMTNSDGHLEIVYVGTDQKLFHKWQKINGDSDTANWTGINPFPGEKAVQVAAEQNFGGRLEMVYVGTDQKLFHKWQIEKDISDTANWKKGDAFPGEKALQATMAQNSDGRLEIVYVGTDQKLFHKWQKIKDISDTANWTAGTQFPNQKALQATMMQNSDGRLEVFYVGNDHRLFHLWQIVPGISEPANWTVGTPFAKDKANQVAVAENSDGRLEIFYVGNDTHLFHNWQIRPGISDPTNWIGETRFPGDSAKQVTVARNADGRLEIFYVGTNSSLYHNWQMKPGVSDTANWAGETVFPGDSAIQVAVAPNLDDHLETVYIGTNTDLFHNWQANPSSNWIDMDGVGGPVVTPAPFGSSNNFALVSGNNCDPLTDVAVMIDITQDIVYTGHGAPMPGASSVTGFTFQLNGFSPAQYLDVAQQYVIGYNGGSLYWQVNNWKNDPNSSQGLTWIILEHDDLAGVAGHKVPAGWRLIISLANDGDGNITGATFSVVDPNGNNPGKHSISISKKDQAPIMAFEMVLIGPGNSESVTLSSGAGVFQYLASSVLNASLDIPLGCVYSSQTQESANTLYGSITAAPSNVLTQSFSLAPVGTLLARRVSARSHPLLTQAPK